MICEVIVPLIVVITVIGLAVYLGSMKWLKIKHVEISHTAITSGIDGLTFLHISDLHGNSDTKLNLDIWSKLSQENFDFAVITGDLVTGGFKNITPHLPYIKSLAEKKPVYYVFGNHERFMKNEVRNALKLCGCTVLENESALQRINMETLKIIGLNDAYELIETGFSGVSELFKGGEGFSLVLSHQPQIFDNLLKYHSFIMVSGHTHGGQVRLPLLPTLFAPGQGLFPQYSHGVYRKGNSVLYISKGIGATDFQFRFFNRPEIAIITLKKG